MHVYIQIIMRKVILLNLHDQCKSKLKPIAATLVSRIKPHNYFILACMLKKKKTFCEIKEHIYWKQIKGIVSSVVQNNCYCYCYYLLIIFYLDLNHSFIYILDSSGYNKLNLGLPKKKKIPLGQIIYSKKNLNLSLFFLLHSRIYQGSFFWKL
jgi:hypothetical protein